MQKVQQIIIFARIQARKYLMKLFKSRKTYYLYNPNTLSYERVYPSAKDRFFGVLRHLSIGIVIGVGIFFIFSRTFDSPVESLFKEGEQAVADTIRSAFVAPEQCAGSLG